MSKRVGGSREPTLRDADDAGCEHEASSPTLEERASGLRGEVGMQGVGRADAAGPPSPRARIATLAARSLEAGRSVLIGGGPGSGKSTLARALVDGLRPAPSALVVRATAEQTRHEYAALTTAWRLAGAPGADDRDLVHTLLRHWSREHARPVVVVEDAQLLDAASADALLAAAAAGALRLVLTVLDDGEPPAAAAAAIERAWVEGWLDRWDLAPLELGEVRAALRPHGSATLAEAATALAATGGIPLLLRELRQQPDAAQGHPGPRMRAALHRTIAPLRDGERELLRGLGHRGAVPEHDATRSIGAHRVDLLVEHGLLLRLEDGLIRAASTLVTDRLQALDDPVPAGSALRAAPSDGRIVAALRSAVEGRASDALAQLPRHGAASREAPVVTGSLLVRALVGDDAERLPAQLESALSDTLRSGDPHRSSLLALVAGAVLLDRGQTARAEDALDAALALPGAVPPRLAAAQQALAARCALARGDQPAAETAYERARAAGPADALGEQQLLYAAIELQLARGRFSTARGTALEAMRAHQRRAQPRAEFAMLAWAGGAEPDALVAPRQRRIDAPRVVLIDRTLRAAAEGSPLGALRRDAEAAAMPRLVRLLRAVAAERRGEDVDRAAALLGAPAAATPLTGRERQIAVLSGEGLSSRQIAERLFLSVRTVESHVLRARRKLGADGKRSLGRRLQELGLG